MSLNKRDQKIISMLFKVAETVEPVSAARIAAAVVYKNNVISIGVNAAKTDPFQKQYQKNPHSLYIHAEISAIKKALKVLSLDELSRATLYVARAKHKSSKKTNKDMVYGLAKPCCGCQKAIAEFDLKKVVYTTNKHGHFETIMLG